MFSNSSIYKYFGFIGFYSFLGIQRHIIYYFWICGSEDMNFVSLQIFEIDLNLIRLWSDQGLTRGWF
jgi:hypothetical protein